MKPHSHSLKDIYRGPIMCLKGAKPGGKGAAGNTANLGSKNKLNDGGKVGLITLPALITGKTYGCLNGKTENNKNKTY